jgi:hypothetical protein
MLANLDKVPERIKDEGGSIDLSKSKFLAGEIDFLRHKIGRNRIQGIDQDVSTIRNHKKPSTPKEMRSFMGLASYKRKFVPMFAGDKKILRGCITEGKKLAWSEGAHKEFENLKKKTKESNRLEILD